MDAIRRFCEWVSRKRIQSLREKYKQGIEEQRIALCRSFAWIITNEDDVGIPLLNSTASNLRCMLKYYDAGYTVRALSPIEYQSAVNTALDVHINTDNVRTILK